MGGSHSRCPVLGTERTGIRVTTYVADGYCQRVIFEQLTYVCKNKNDTGGVPSSGWERG